MLDEEANAEGMPLYAITDFMAHFRLTDEGLIELEGFGEYFGDHLSEQVHLILGELDVTPGDASSEERARIMVAVEQERTRQEARPTPEPDTELGKQINAQMDLPTSVISRYVHRVARKVLQESKPKGKPH